MKLVDLRQQLRSRKLTTSGNKKTLMARLAAHLTERETSNHSSSSDSDGQDAHTSGRSESPDTTPESERSQSRQRDTRRRQRGQASSDQSPAHPHRDPQRSSRRRQRDRQRGRYAVTDGPDTRSRSPISSRKKGHQRAPNRTNSRLSRTTRSRQDRSGSRTSSSSGGGSNTDSESSASESSTATRSRARKRHHHSVKNRHHKTKRRRRRSVSTSSSSSTVDSDTTTTSSLSSSDATRRKRHKKKAKRLRSGTKAKLDKLTVSCCPPLARRYSSKIVRGEYVSFDKLTIPKKHRNDTSGKGGPKHTRRRPVTGLTTWIEAWNRFMGVVVANKPSKSLELIKYQTLITTAFQDYPPEACIEYDRRFRQLAAKNKDLAWGKYKEDLFVWCFSPKPASAGSFRAYRPTILSRLGPAPGSATHTATGAEICIRYNLPRGCTMEGCRYKHVCSRRGCEGDHPATRCPSKQQPP